MPAFICNICGRTNSITSYLELEREKPSCLCGSNVRFRWLIHQLSMQLFGRSMPLEEFPFAEDIHALGLSDDSSYADVLGRKLGFLNTFFDAEPRFDITDHGCGEEESLDFIIASEVFEHIVAPVQVAFDNLYRILKPNGFVLFSTPWRPDGETQEHYPDLHNWHVSQEDGTHFLINRTAGGTIQTYANLRFHGGPGQTLEMRLYSRAALEAHFHKAGFACVTFASAPIYELGIVFRERWSRPCLVGKGRG